MQLAFHAPLGDDYIRETMSAEVVWISDLRLFMTHWLCHAPHGPQSHHLALSTRPSLDSTETRILIELGLSFDQLTPRVRLFSRLLPESSTHAQVGAECHRFPRQVCGSGETQALIHPSGSATWIAYTSSGEFPNPGNAERCGRCHVRLGWCLESMRAEVDEAAQSSHAEPTQEMSADRF